MLYAIIDIGSSTVRMAVYNINYGKIEMLMKKKHTLGLAAYVKDGKLQQSGIDKLCNILNEFRDFLNDFRIENVSAFTTAAVRNAKNSSAVIDELQSRTHIPVRIITGDEEAEFDFIGVMREISAKTGIIIDAGGASTEVIYYKNSAIEKKTSIPLGALLLHTKYVEDFLPSSDEISDMQKETIAALLTLKDFTGIKITDICGIGGTAKSMRLLYNNIFTLPDANACMEVKNFDEIINRYTRDQQMTQEHIVTLLKTAPDRLQTIIPGIVLINTVCHHFGADHFIYSDTGMREGFIYDQIINKNKL
ncbi:Ppx/GppA phosphatase family protein [Pectinatus haikarae]|uniref:Ppx/GppA phosphatase family protein n=1 Tax=Pectinatus haikarae TaxID=349096 RepID=UPI0018C83D84|nr:exopolyphosphatase [Pectinatus haikarae]